MRTEAQRKQNEENMYQMAMYFVIRKQRAIHPELQKYLRVPVEGAELFLVPRYEKITEMLERMVNDNILQKLETGSDHKITRYEVMRKRMPFALDKELKKAVDKALKLQAKHEAYRQKSGDLLIQALNEFTFQHTGFKLKETLEGNHGDKYDLNTEYHGTGYYYALLKNGEKIAETVIDVEELMRKTA